MDKALGLHMCLELVWLHQVLDEAMNSIITRTLHCLYNLAYLTIFKKNTPQGTFCSAMQCYITNFSLSGLGTDQMRRSHVQK